MKKSFFNRSGISSAVIFSLLVQSVLSPLAIAQDLPAPAIPPLPNRTPGDLKFEIVENPKHYEETISRGLRPDINGNLKLDRNQTDYWVGKEISFDNVMRRGMEAATIVGMDFSNRIYKQMVEKHQLQPGQNLPDWEMDKLQTQVNEMMGSLYTKMETLKSTGNFPAKHYDQTALAIKFIADVADAFEVPGTAAAADFAQMVLEQMKEEYKRTEGAKDQKHTQQMLYDAKRRFQDVFGQSYANGSTDLAFRQMWLKVFENQTIADPWTPAEENFKRDRKFHEGLLQRETYSIIKKALAENIDGKGRLNVHIPSLEKQLKGVQDEIIHHIDQSNLNILLYLEGKEQKKLQDEKEKQDKQDLFDSARSSVSLVSGILSFAGDKESARIVAGTGTALIDTAVALDKFVSSVRVAEQAGKVLMSCVNLAAAIGNIVGALFSLFGGGKDPTQMILEAIQKLSEQVARLQKNMNDRFDQVDRNINRLFLAMQAGFEQVNRMLRGLEYNSAQIRDSLGGIQESLVRLDAALYSYLKAGFGERIREETELCLSAGPEMTLSHFRACLVRFNTVATLHTTNALSAGAPEALLGSHGERMRPETDFFGRLASDLTKGIWENIGTIRSLVQYRYGDNSMRAGENRPLVNAQDWTLSANDYIAFVSQHPDLIRLDPNDVARTTNEILAAGESTAQALANFGRGMQVVDDKSKQVTSQSALYKTIEDYERWLEQSQRVMHTERQVYEQSPELKGYALNKPLADQVSRYSYQPQDIHACPGYTIPSVNSHPVRMPVFVAPANLEALLPQHIKVAADLGLISLDTCYDGLEWIGTESRYRDLSYQDIFSKIEFHIQFRYRSRQQPDAKPIVFSERVIAATQHTQHGVVCYHVRFSYQVPNPGPDAINYSQGQHPLGIRRGEVKWAHGDIHPPNSFSWKEIASVNAWGGGEQLYSKFVAESRETLAEDQRNKVQTEVTAMVEDFLERHRGQFDKLLRRGVDVGGDLNRTTQALTGSKQLMEGLIYLAFPKSMTSDDELRGLFRGKDALLDTTTLLFSHDDSNNPQPLDPERTSLYKDNAPKVEKLKGILHRLVETNRDGEDHEFLSSARTRLETLKVIQSKLVPSVSLGDALADLKTDIEKYVKGSR